VANLKNLCHFSSNRNLRGSILVQTDDAVLLAHKSQAQKIKELVKKLGEDSKLKKLV
jgi:hypothetical protein